MGKTGVESLSGQQERCLRLVAEGFTSLEISGQLGISDKTVNRHVEMAAQKLGARNRAHAARGVAPKAYSGLLGPLYAQGSVLCAWRISVHRIGVSLEHMANRSCSHAAKRMQKMRNAAPT